MIRYALLCREDHAFEAWFHDSGAFDQQSEDGHVACPQCGSAEIRKAVMAPAVRRSSRSTPTSVPEAMPNPPTPSVLPPAPAPVEPPRLSDEAAAQMRAALRELHARIRSVAENVGPAFPDEARSIHNGEEPARAIYGTATQDEVRSLLEDGIGIMPIPNLPDDRH